MGVLAGITKDETKGVGGIKRVFLTNHSSVKNLDIAAGIATFDSNAGVWKEFVLGKESGSNYSETGTGAVGAGTISYEQMLAAIFKKNQVSKRNELKVLGEDLTIAVIEDSNGEVVVYGGENGLDMTSGVRASGAQYSEANNMTVTLRGLEREPAPSISATDYTALSSGNAVGAGTT